MTLYQQFKITTCAIITPTNANAIASI